MEDKHRPGNVEDSVTQDQRCQWVPLKNSEKMRKFGQIDPKRAKNK